MRGAMHTTPDKCPVDFGPEEMSLKDFASRASLPKLGKIRRGQYSCLGSGRKLNDVAFVHSVYSSVCVLAETHFSGRSESLFVVPLAYEGLFDVLSEDRKPVKPMSSAAELADCKSTAFLVRESVKAAVADQSSTTPARKGTLESGEVVRRSAGAKHESVGAERCVSFLDSNNRRVFLDTSQKFSLSPINSNSKNNDDDDGVTGVYTITRLVEKFVFPLNVQLAAGDFFSSPNYRPTFRLLGTVDVDFALVIPWKAAPQALSVPLTEPLVLSAPRDRSYRGTEEFRRVADFAKTIEVLQRKTISILTTVGNLRIDNNHNHHHNNSNNNNKNKIRDDKNNDNDAAAYEEIDAIYKYIREGGQLSDFATRDGIDAIKRKPIDPTKPRDGLEREIWGEPIYADVSKLKARKMNAERHKSADSELANIGTGQHVAGVCAKVTSSYKNTLQKCREKFDSTLRAKAIEKKSKLDIEWIPYNQPLGCGSTIETSDPNSSNNSNNNNVTTHVHEQKDATKNNSGFSAELADGNKARQLTSYFALDDQTDQSKRKSIESTNPQKGNLEVENLGKPIFNENRKMDTGKPKSPVSIPNDGGFIRTGKHCETEPVKSPKDGGSGWNVSVIREDSEEDSKKTRVRINYGGMNLEESSDGVCSPEAPKMILQDFKTTHQDAGSIVSSGRADDSHPPIDPSIDHPTFNALSDTGTTTPNEHGIQRAINTMTHENSIRIITTTINENSNFPPKYHPPPIDSNFHRPMDCASFSEAQEFNEGASVSVHSESSFKIHPSPRKSYENVSTIRLGSNLNHSDHDRSRDSSDAQSVTRISCKSSNFGKTSSSSKAFPGGSTFGGQSTAGDGTLNAQNEPRQKENHYGVTAIKIDKFGSQRTPSESKTVAHEEGTGQEIKMSPFGNTQIFIRQAYPSSKNHTCSSKLYVNKTFF